MVENINDASFAQTIQSFSGVVLVDFWAPWCGPCRVLGPIIEEIAKTVNEIKVVKINVDENPALAAQFGIRSIPTVILFANGEPKEQIIGVRSKDDYISLIQKYQS